MATTLQDLMQFGKADVVEFVVRLFAEKGQAAYIGEPVSQLEHALQAAWLAEQEGASPVLVSAALLHDFGHLLHDLPEDCAHHGIDDRHEELGSRWLQRHFGPAVVEPIRLHVETKRYLCAVDPEYLELLSPASVLSLALQGGPMSDAEVLRFRCQPYSTAAIAVRRWDDRAKIPGLVTPNLEYFHPHLLGAVREPARTAVG